MTGHLPQNSSGWLLAVTLVTVPTQLLAQSIGQGSADADLSFSRIFANLLFLLALVSAAWVLMKVRGRPLELFQPLANRRIIVSEVTRISTQASLCLILFDGHEYLLAVTPHAVTMIEKRPIQAMLDKDVG
jgi:flagellar biogenesis protein FliO